MKTTVTTIASFAAAHHLPDHEGKCRNLHGHTYSMEVTVAGDPQPSGPSRGMVIDFADLRSTVEQAVTSKLDHSLLNEVLDFVPTVEAIAGWAFQQLAKAGLPVVRVRLYEGANSYAEVVA
jgi:6-pyruvoyltetrahydropterin/6-carboxytetrahydropterin synthase